MRCNRKNIDLTPSEPAPARFGSVVSSGKEGIRNDSEATKHQKLQYKFDIAYSPASSIS
ncbi:hypothetical protein AGR1B_Lc10477 [Agrobacterium fabacearum S56]|nr:hypothetical protein AGR1B_Lc10477 [Agrobacterium fabacearum S56]